MNETIRKFGYPESLIGETDGWVVLLRPKQVTAGSMILAAKSDVESLGGLSATLGADLPEAASRLEACLSRVVAHDKVNYLALMMVDSHVHFHVIPRYDGRRAAGNTSILDRGWPKHPNLTDVVDVPSDDWAVLLAELRAAWRN